MVEDGLLVSPSADGGAASPVVLVGVSGGEVSLAVPTLPAVDDMFRFIVVVVDGGGYCRCLRSMASWR